jgi:hypothetical protein
MRNIAIWFRDLLKLVVDLIYFKLTRRQSINAYKRLLSAFYLLGGSINPIASRFLGEKPLSFAKIGVLDSYSTSQLKKAEQQLNQEGYVVFEDVLSEQFCNDFLQMSFKIDGITRVMDGGVGQVQKVKFDRANPQSIRVDYSSQDLVNEPLVQQLISDESILGFAQSYLKSAPIIDLVAMWWHTDFSRIADKEAAQWFHFDMERIKWIKFFFYITDVTESTGPHVFVPKTHKTFGIPFALRRKGYTRLSDDEVQNFFPSNTWREFTGKRGTLIVEDTRGLHKGKHCVDGDRLLFQIEFTSSAFGAKLNPVILVPSNKVPQMQHALTRYPSVYSMMINLPE